MYIIYTKVLTGSTLPIGFVMNLFLNKDLKDHVSIRRLKCSDNNFILKSLLLNQCKFKLPKEVYPSTFCETQSFKLISLNDLKNGYGVIYVENYNYIGEIYSTIILKDFLNLELLSEFKESQKNEKIILITPALNNSLVIFEKLKSKCGFNFSCNEQLVFSIEESKSLIKTKGTKTEILISKKKSNIFLYSFKYAKGILLLIENTTDKNCKAKFIFTKLVNLKSDEEINKKDGSIDLVMGKKENVYLNFSQIEQNSQTSIEYKFAFQFIQIF